MSWTCPAVTCARVVGHVVATVGTVTFTAIATATGTLNVIVTVTLDVIVTVTLDSVVAVAVAVAAQERDGLQRVVGVGVVDGG